MCMYVHRVYEVSKLRNKDWALHKVFDRTDLGPLRHAKNFHEARSKRRFATQVDVMSLQ